MLTFDKITKNFYDALNENNSVQVHSVYHNMINVMTCRGLFTIQNKSIGLTPLSAVVSDPIHFHQSLYPPGTVLRLSTRTTHVDSEDHEDHENHEDPMIVKPILNKTACSFANDFVQNEFVTLMETHLQAHALNATDQMGFSNLILKYKSFEPFINANATYTTPLHQMIIAILNCFVLDYQTHKRPNYVYLIKLLGLGNGLTPSGDDFLVGLLSGLHFFDLEEDERQLKNIIASNKHKTTAISESFMRESLDDCYSEIILSLYGSLEIKSSSLISQNVTAILSYGHSSGMDILSGILFAVYLIDFKNEIK